jgi:hypothetical protein
MQDESPSHAEQVALFRYGLIADLIHLRPGGGRAGRYGRYVKLREKAAAAYTIPGSRRTRVAVEAIRGWLHDYREHGFEGLKPKPRADVGTTRHIPQHVADLLVALKDEHRDWTIPTVVAEARRMAAAGEADVPEDLALPTSTVHRLLTRAGAPAASAVPATPPQLTAIPVENTRWGKGGRVSRGRTPMPNRGPGSSASMSQLHFSCLDALALPPCEIDVQKAQAPPYAKRIETGAVTFVQRFDGTLGCFVHFHVVVVDGVFARDESGSVSFVQGRAPSQKDVADVAARVQRRMTRWLRRRGLIDERPPEERSNEASGPTPLEACMQMSLVGGTFLRLDEDGTPLDLDDDRFRTRGKSPWSAESCGFDVHAGVTVRAGDREGLERLFRYGARPPFSLERLSLLRDGRVAYRLRKPRRNGATHLVLEPLRLLARIAAVIPPPRFPLLRLSGVFAPSSSWRSSVVPKGPARAADASRAPATKKRKPKSAPSPPGSPILAGPAEQHDAPPRTAHASRGPRTSLGSSIAPGPFARIDWGSLLKRVYLEDVLACPCRGRRRILADVTDPEVVASILRHLNLPTEPPPVARARDPTCDAA